MALLSGPRTDTVTRRRAQFHPLDRRSGSSG